MSLYNITYIVLCKLKTKPHKLIKMSNKIPSSLKHNVWTLYIGEKFDGKCEVKWCNNRITPFTFEAGHNIPFSKGGSTTIDNLRPICSDCNKSMGNRFTIDEFSEQYKSSKEKIIVRKFDPLYTQNNSNDSNDSNNVHELSSTSAPTHATAHTPVHLKDSNMLLKVFAFICSCMISKEQNK